MCSSLVKSLVQINLDINFFLIQLLNGLQVYKLLNFHGNDLKVAKSHEIAVRLADFDAISRSHGQSNFSHRFLNFLLLSCKYCQLIML